MAATKTPSGVKITRNGRKFTVEWKGESGSAFTVKFYRSHDSAKKANAKWKRLDTYTGKATKKAFTVSEAEWKNCDAVKVSVSGKVSGKGASKTREKTFELYAPKKPAVSMELAGENACKVTVTPHDEAGDAYPLATLLIQTRKSYEKSWTDVKTSGKGAYSATKEEASADISRGSFTRWYRARCIGAAGGTDWVSASHNYTPAPAATVSKVTADENKSDGTSFTVEYSLGGGTTEKTVVEYAFTTPTENLGCPSGAGWKSGSELVGTGASRGKGTIRFPVDDVIDVDQCLFVRVVTYHDEKPTYGVPKLVKCGTLKAPAVSSLTAENGKVSVSVTSNTQVPNACTEVSYGGEVIGIMAEGTGSGTFAYTEREGGVFSVRSIVRTGTDTMASEPVAWNAAVPSVAGLAASPSGTGRALVSWTWEAEPQDAVEISWSTDPDAWESTDEPKSHVVSGTSKPYLYVSDLDEGATYHFRARYGSGSGNDIVWGALCAPVSVSLASAPASPALLLEEAVIAPDGLTRAYWAYASGDGTAQGYAELAEVTSSGEYIRTLATAAGVQSVEVDAQASGLAAGTHWLAVRVGSASGMLSDASAPAELSVAERPSVSVATSLKAASDADKGDYSVLDALPLTATLTGVEGGTYAATVTRAADYQVDRPDEGTRSGYAGEVVAYQEGGSVSIDADSLAGYLDDGADYILACTATDPLGQVATESIPFTVAWAVQPAAPAGTVKMRDGIAILTGYNDGANEGDTCDIYRLSADKPQLVVQGGGFGTAYVDPFPAFGEGSGYRFVTRSATGDVVTAEGGFAWVDVEAVGTGALETVIDFGGESVSLALDMDLSHAWGKQFTRTRYLNGSVTGDYAEGAERDLSVSATVVTGTQGQRERLRRLAVFAGACNVRTPDGSSFKADVEVKETASSMHAAAYTLTIKGTDPVELDGMTLEEWEAANGLV